MLGSITGFFQLLKGIKRTAPKSPSLHGYIDHLIQRLTLEMKIRMLEISLMLTYVCWGSI